MKSDLMVIALGLDLSNDGIIEHMKLMKKARKKNSGVSNVVCLISGFDKDGRELRDIPEARAFCRRLVRLGFISYLDYLTTCLDACPPELAGTLGAMEVWLLAEGKLQKETEIDEHLMKVFDRALLEANAYADGTLGTIDD